MGKYWTDKTDNVDFISADDFNSAFSGIETDVNSLDTSKANKSETESALALKTDNEDFETHIADFTAHKTDAAAHEEAFAAERARFNPIYCNALFGSAEGANITVSDAVEGTPLALTLYGKCTETLSDSSAEKSPDNPATITGIGESGSVTVTVTDADGTAQEIAIPLSEPLYGIKHPTTGEWLVRDEIRVEDGKVQLAHNIKKYEITGDEQYINTLNTTLMVIVPNAIGVIRIPTLSQMCYAVISTHIKSTGVYNTGINLGYQGDYNWQIKINIPTTYTGITSEDSADERKTKLRAWLSELYNAGTPLTCYYAVEVPPVTDITDTEAGQALLALVSQNGTTITNSEGADMEITYNRDINKAFAEINNAIIALGGTI